MLIKYVTGLLFPVTQNTVVTCFYYQAGAAAGLDVRADTTTLFQTRAAQTTGSIFLLLFMVLKIHSR